MNIDNEVDCVHCTVRATYFVLDFSWVLSIV